MSPGERVSQLIEEIVSEGTRLVVHRPFFFYEQREMFVVSEEWGENARKGDTLLEALEEFKRNRDEAILP